MMRRFTRPLLILLALIFLLEAWLWSHLAPLVGWLVARLPWREFKAKVAAAIERLPPAATFLVFIVPILLLLPLKFLGLWLLARGAWLGALMVLGAAKIVSLGVTAFVFDLTRPKLLQLAWFRWLYERILAWLVWAHALVDPIKQRIRRLLAIFAPHRAGRAISLFWRIRRMMRARAV